MSKNKSQKKEPPKSRHMMYEQQLRHLPAKTINNLVKIVEKQLTPEKYALIVHDKDVKEDGTPVEPHVHVMMSFTNARSARSVSKKLGEFDANGRVKDEFIELWEGSSKTGYSYLVHATDKARAKKLYQYDLSEVKANFDYVEYMEDIRQQVKFAKSSVGINFMLDALMDNSITKEELERRLTGSEYGKFKNRIEAVEALRLKNNAKEWRKTAKAENRTNKCIWLYGTSGTGKTSFAKDHASKKGNYYVSGSSKDIFQGYAGQHTIILDELRPNSITYGDFLKIIDPHSIDNETMAPSRFYDKALAVDLFIVTTPFDPFQFYQLTVGNNKVDGFDQLERRLTMVVKMEQDAIYLAHFDPTQKTYVIDPTTKKDNPYSSLARGQVNINKEDLYNEVFV